VQFSTPAPQHIRDVPSPVPRVRKKSFSKSVSKTSHPARSFPLEARRVSPSPLSPQISLSFSSWTPSRSCSPFYSRSQRIAPPFCTSFIKAIVLLRSFRADPQLPHDQIVSSIVSSVQDPSLVPQVLPLEFRAFFGHPFHHRRRPRRDLQDQYLDDCPSELPVTSPIGAFALVLAVISSLLVPQGSHSPYL